MSRYADGCAWEYSSGHSIDRSCLGQCISTDGRPDQCQTVRHHCPPQRRIDLKQTCASSVPPLILSNYISKNNVKGDVSHVAVVATETWNLPFGAALAMSRVRLCSTLTSSFDGISNEVHRRIVVVILSSGRCFVCYRAESSQWTRDANECFPIGRSDQPKWSQFVPQSSRHRDTAISFEMFDPQCLLWAVASSDWQRVDVTNARPRLRFSQREKESLMLTSRHTGEQIEGNILICNK